MDAGEVQHLSVAHIESRSLPIMPPQQEHEYQPWHVVEKSQDVVGMPWTKSIVPEQELTFMPFWMHQMSVMKSSLAELKATPATNKAGTRDFSISTGDNVRVANLCFSSSHFRKIRMTYFDAGPQAQVFNSLWYPAPEYNLPVFGIDLLQFHGGKKHLAVMDFQPIHEKPEQHAVPNYEDLWLVPIRNQHPLLRGKMSTRFYNETQFFSKEMLFARFDACEMIQQDVWPAFQQCLNAYLTMVHTTKPSWDSASQVLARQQAYDQYSAHRDPALHMFKSKFGQSWADEYVHEFLFDKSR